MGQGLPTAIQENRHYHLAPNDRNENRKRRRKEWTAPFGSQPCRRRQPGEAAAQCFGSKSEYAWDATQTGYLQTCISSLVSLCTGMKHRYTITVGKFSEFPSGGLKGKGKGFIMSTLLDNKRTCCLVTVPISFKKSTIGIILKMNNRIYVIQCTTNIEEKGCTFFLGG
jgi:hypothetical protein